MPVCWTIDRTSKAAGGADNGFLDCARAHTPGYKSDSSTSEAITNLVGCLGAGSGTANIVGHGNDGLIVTGQGQSPSDPTKFVTTWNQNKWGPLFSSLKGKAGTIKLWACHPGTGQAGADLLYAMMLVTNATCMGPTGFLYCGGTGLTLEAKSVWQTVSPGHPKPTPIVAPTAHFVIPFESWSFNMESYKSNLSTLKRVEVSRGGAVLLSLTDDAAQSFAQLIDFREPVHVPGIVGGLITAEISLAFQDSAGDHTHHFVVYNNRLLQDSNDESLYYAVSEHFGAALMSGLR